MSIEANPWQKKEEGREKTYSPERMNSIDRATLAISLGVLSTIISERNGETSEIIKYLAERSHRGYETILDLEATVDEHSFGELKKDFEERINSAETEEEKNKLTLELEKIKSSRERVLGEENAEKKLRNSLKDSLAKFFS